MITLETGSPAAIAQGLALFAALAILGSLVGLGALSVTGVVAEPWRRWMLAPFIATVVWALPADLLVRLGLTMAQITPWVGLASLVLAIVGAASVSRTPWRESLSAVALLIVCWGIALVLMWPIVERGLTATLGSGNLDTTFYSSLASAYWRYGITDVPRHELFFERFFDLNMRLGIGRNHSVVLLALFSPLVQAGESMFVRNLFAAWSLFTLAATMGFFGWSWHVYGSLPPRAPRAATFAVVGACIGWAAVPTLVGNWDNGLFVSVGPALAGLVVRPPPTGVAYPAVLGAISAYGFYTYPELAPILCLLLLPLLAAHLRDTATRRMVLTRYAVAALIALALASIGARPLVRYTMSQMASTLPGVDIRPGGAFAQGLVSALGDPASWWAMGSEHAIEASWSLASGLGVVLTVLALAGAWHLIRRGALGEVTTVVLLAMLCAYFSLIDLYGYATYKVLNVGWWIVVLCLVEGLRRVSNWRTTSSVAGRRTLATAGTVTLLAVVVVTLVVEIRHRWTIYNPAFVTKLQPSMASLVRLRDAASAEPARDVLVAGALSDYTVLPWVFYALKDSPLRLFHEKGLEPPVPGGAGWPRSDVMPEATLVADGEGRGGRDYLQSPDFDLVASRSLIVLTRLENPNGLDEWGGWLGTEPMAITVHAAPGRRAELRFEAEPGPSLPESPARTLLLTTDGAAPESDRIHGKTEVAFPFTTTGQSQVLKLSTSERPTISVMPNGDRRPLMVAIRRIQVILVDTPSAR